MIWRQKRMWCGKWPCTCDVCNKSLSCKDILNDLLHTSQMCEYVHLMKVKNILLWLMCFLWLPSLPHFSYATSVGPTCKSCVCHVNIGNFRKWKGVNFWWSPVAWRLYIFLSKFETVWFSNLDVWREVERGHDSPSMHVITVLAYIRQWHRIPIITSFLKSPSPNKPSFHFGWRVHWANWVGLASNKWGGSLPLDCDGWSKTLIVVC